MARRCARPYSLQSSVLLQHVAMRPMQCRRYRRRMHEEAEPRQATSLGMVGRAAHALRGRHPLLHIIKGGRDRNCCPSRWGPEMLLRDAPGSPFIVGSSVGVMNGRPPRHRTGRSSATNRCRRPRTPPATPAASSGRPGTSTQADY